MADSAVRQQRRRAAHRRRRILLNNEGGDLLSPEAATPEGLLSVRTTPLVGTPVDTVLYCLHYSFGSCRHNTAVGEVNRMIPPPVNQAHHGPPLIRQRRDCLQIIVEFGHQHGIEAFWSMRMNDVHDGAAPELTSRFTREHPE